MIAISTAFKRAYIALSINGKEDYYELDEGNRHSENLLPEIDNLLQKNDLQLSQNHTFALVIGPGSFTGIRISLALVKGFMAGMKNQGKVVAVTTNEFMAYSYLNQSKKHENFLTVIDALSGLYYVCEFNGEKKVGEERVITKEELDKIQLKKVGLSEEDAPVDEKITPKAIELLRLAIKMQNEGKFVDIDSLAPLYLRKSQAEDNLEKKI